jgi:flagellar hook assembly protein FlgD
MQRYQFKFCKLVFIFTILFLGISGIADAAAISWSGGGPDNLSSNNLNWAGGQAPQSGDDVIFDIASSKDCTWDLVISPASIHTDASYSGTITMDADITITGNFTIQGGTIIQNGNIIIEALSPPSAPTATTDSSTNINGIAATLNATVNPNNSEATVYFEWGPDTSYGNSTTPESIGNGTTGVSFSKSLTGFSLNTTYHYRVVATNGFGTSYGYDVSFTTTAGTTVSGTIFTDTTWTYAGSPYIVIGNIFVYGTSSEPTLTIEPGVEVRFNGLYYLSIGYSLYKGRLVAQGTSANPIIFTSNNASPAAGNWYGIRFYNHATTESSLDYVTVEYAGYQYGSIYISNSSPSINNSSIINNANKGIDITGNSAPLITNSVISSNVTYGIYVANNSTPLISSTAISSNGSYAISISANDAGGLGAGNSANSNGIYGIELRASTIASDSTWPYQPVPYIVTGNISVYGISTEPTLTIEPGVEVRFSGLYYLNIGYSSYKGRLAVQGTSANPIIFTSSNASPAAGNWYGIRFYNHATTESSLDYVTIEYAGYQYGGIYISNSSPTITNSTIRRSKYDGMYMAGDSAPAITYSVISDNSSEGVYVSGTNASVAFITNTTFENNGSYSLDIPVIAVLGAGNIYNENSGIKLSGSTVSTDTTWSYQATPYIVTGHINVYGASEPTLTIEPGTEIRFDGRYYLKVGSSSTSKGTLLAQGTASSPIKFTSVNQTSGDWYGIQFYYQAATGSVLDNVTVEYGGYSNGGIYINNSSPAISNSVIRNNSNKGIYTNGTGSLSINGSRIENNEKDGLYVGNNVALLSLTNNSFINNGAYAASMLAHVVIGPGNTFLNETGIEFRGGTISSNTTWQYRSVPYIVSGNISVYGTSEPTLTVEPGVIVKFNGLYFLYIGNSSSRGILKAQGTYANSIVFTSNKATPAIGDWSGISFINTTADNIIDYATVEYAGYYSGNINISHGLITINNSVIKNSKSSGINLSAGTIGDSNAIITGSSITDNYNYGVKASVGGSDGVFSIVIANSSIANNGPYGLMLSDSYNTGKSIANITFRSINNHTSHAIYSTSSILKINHCNIEGNGVGIYSETGKIADARFNWWGDISGPSGNGSGVGQSVSTGITYEPWLATPYTYPFYNKEFNASHQEFNPLIIDADYTFSFPDNADWIFAIKDSLGGHVKTFIGSGSGGNVAWDGKDDNNAIVPDGIYGYQLSSTSLGNGTQSAPFIGDVLMGMDLPQAEIMSPSDGQFINELALDIQGIASDNSDFSSYKVEYGTGSAPTSWTLINSSTSSIDSEGILATLDLTNLTGLHYTIRLSVYDLAGNTTTSLIGINRGFEIYDLTISNPYFSPDDDGLKDTTTIVANITYQSNWTVDIKNSSGTLIRSYSGSGTFISSTWDGKDSSGNFRPAGDYTVSITATEPVSGEVTSVSDRITIVFDPPTAITEAVTDLSMSGVTLNGTVNPKGSETSVFFEWGTDISYGNSTTPQIIGSDMDNIALADIITDISINTTYHYRIVATNTYGTSYGGDMDFTTLPIKLSITYPVNSDLIYRPDVMVRGTVSNIAGKATSVTINGKIAVVYNGVFFINHFPLQEGQNVITANAVDTDGYTATSSITVNADTSAPYITLRSNVYSGTSPLKAYFSISMEISETASSYQMDFDGDGANDYTGVSYENINFIYILEDIYFPTVTVTDSSGNAFSDAIAIPVLPWVDTLRLLQSKWEAMKTALIAGDIDTAVSYFAEDEQDEYMNYFTQLSSNDINSIYSSIVRLRINSVTDNIAQCSAIRSESTGTYSYPVIFIKDGEGIWRINGF